MAAVPVATAAAATTPAFEAIRSVDVDLADIGQRLAIANASLCDRQEPGLGLLLHTPDQYARDVREMAIRHFRFAGPVGVEAVMPGSPAAAAGIRADDTLLGVGPAHFRAIDDQAKPGTTTLIEVTRQIIKLPVDQPLVLHLRRGGVDQDLTIVPVPTCLSRFEVAFGPQFIAQADGEMVQIGSRLFADYPKWVAAPIAHELAHNILHHRERLEEVGVSFGLLSGLGRNVRYFRRAELEADILSISLLANAGYDPGIALRFWRSFGPAHAGGIMRSRSHPDWKARISVMERTIAELGPGKPHRPHILDTRTSPLDGDWQELLGTGR